MMTREEIEAQIFHWNAQIVWNIHVLQHSSEALLNFLSAWLNLRDYYEAAADTDLHPDLFALYLHHKEILSHIARHETGDPDIRENAQIARDAWVECMQEITYFVGMRQEAAKKE